MNGRERRIRRWVLLIVPGPCSATKIADTGRGRPVAPRNVYQCHPPVTDMSPPHANRGFRWSISALMGIVAAVAVLLAAALAWMRPEPPAPGHVLDQLPLRMQRLGPGMTEQRVWRELGLAGYRKGPQMCAGSSDCFWTSYSPGPGYGLVLFFDETVSPPRFVGAHLVDPQGVIHALNLALQRTRPATAVSGRVEGGSGGPVR
jgi:hypothetical protein